MINLNLLSPAKKLNLKKKKTFLQVTRFVSYSLLTLIFAFIFMKGTSFLINEEIASVTASIDTATRIPQTTEDTSLEAKITQYNNLVKSTNNKLAAYIKWSTIIEDFTKTVPSGIQLTYLGMDKTNKKIKLRGKANTRDDLVNFKNNLDDNKNYSNIDIPITNFLEKTDIDFTIDFNLEI